MIFILIGRLVGLDGGMVMLKLNRILNYNVFLCACIEIGNAILLIPNLSLSDRYLFEWTTWGIGFLKFFVISYLLIGIDLLLTVPFYIWRKNKKNLILSVALFGDAVFMLWDYFSYLTTL